MRFLKKFNRILVYIILIAVCYVLETSVFKRYLSFGGVVPNLLIVVTSSIGFMRGKKEGLIVGFFCGLLMDILGGGLLGFYAMIYMVIGYVNGLFLRLFFDDDIKLPLALISGSELCYGLVVYFFLFFLQSDFDFSFHLFHIIIPELVYTSLVTLLLYQIILFINHRLEEKEKRSAGKFV